MKAKTKTTATKEEATPALVPKLRFPEFREAEGWTEKPLKAAAHINPANGGLPELFVYIDLESVDAGELKAKERISRIGAPSRAQRLVERGDIIYQVVRPYQRNNLLCEFEDDEDYVASTGYAQLRAKGSNRFLYQSIHTDSFVGRVIAKCTGSNYPAINSSDLAEIHLPIPPTIPEQQKIAECLSSVDELIAAQARKLAALKTHKKGLMQQLFPREGETQPRLRFPEFQNAGEWEPRNVSQLAKVTTGAKDTQNKVEDGKYPFFVRSQTVERIDSYSYDGEAVLTSGDGVGVGKNFHHINGKFDFHQRVYCIYDFDKEASGLFFYLYFSEHFGERVMRMSAKNSVDSVRMAMITEMPVLLPPLPEQQRIASCLTSLDDLIAAQTQKHEALKTHKQGLMQQLFPTVAGASSSNAQQEEQDAPATP